MAGLSRWLCAAILLTSAGCNGCGTKSGEVDDLSFKRCAQADAPSARTLQTDALKLDIKERIATLTPKGALRMAAFTGPVDGPLSRSDMAQLSAASPQLILYLGGLGSTLELASANLALLATLRVPVLFVAGGADRLDVVQEAFGDLAGDAAERLVHASGLRALEIGKERFAIVPGAPLGRYAIDEDACGFVQDDLDELRELLDTRGKARTWLLAWGAPSGFGVTRGLGGLDAGSPELSAFAKAVGASGGLFAYPEVQAALPSRGSGGPGGFALVVPRLGRTGSLREGRGFVPRSLSLLSLGETGLGLATRP